jgi:hypothetical protein
MGKFAGIVRCLAAMLLLAGCSGRDPEPPMAEARYVDLCVRDLGLDRRHASDPESLRNAREALYRTLGVTREDVERTRDWYRRHPERALRAMEKVAERLEAEEAARRGSGPVEKGPTR